MASNHLLLVGMLKALRAHGLRVPGDVGVVGFDEYPWTPLMDPPLTVVHQPRLLIGETAARRLTGRVRGDIHGEGEILSIEPTLIVRTSCGAPRSEQTGWRSEDPDESMRPEGPSIRRR
jgi:LacI family transcriptional regulator